MSLNSKSSHSADLDEVSPRLREDQPRLRICFDPEQEIPLLQKWFAMNNHPSRTEVEQYTNILNTAPGRAGRPKLDVHNIIYWFKNTRAALRRVEIRQLRSSTFNIEELRSELKDSESAGSDPCERDQGKEGGKENIHIIYI